ncbi:uncharacterized protein LOC129789184 [Lutzomyia longipalpis]|uniref:uncharacterized protein LOC129789184 n=1 Tax=Lutzomyia longipalpis TaxID=7200 RepID=UPI0024843934|nr:uncharacterized protein LOC129789184 [Lutzomyia longipalpis]
MMRTPPGGENKGETAGQESPPKDEKFRGFSEESIGKENVQELKMISAEKSILDLEITETRMKLRLAQLEKQKAMENLHMKTSTPIPHKKTPVVAYRVDDDFDDDEPVGKVQEGPQLEEKPRLEEKPAPVVPEVPRPTERYVSDMQMFMARQTLTREVKQFDGCFREWPGFINWWRSTTAACAFTPTEDITRLDKCLKGDAREAVQFLLYDSKNVPRILDVLEKRFGRPEFLVMSMLEKVRELPAVREEDPESVMKFASAVENLMASLEIMGRASYKESPHLIWEIVEKLPTNMKIQWSEVDTSSGFGDLDVLVKFLNKKAEAAMKRIMQSRDKMSTEKSPEKGKQNQRSGKTHKVMTTTEDKKKTCNICDEEGHFANNCPHLVQAALEDRRKLIMNRSLCFLCLMKGHPAADCRRTSRCSIDGCGKKHHELLHTPTERPQPTPGPSTAPRDEIVPHVNTTMYSYSTAKNKILMKIIPVIVTGSKGTVRTFAFLDDGSSITMIKASLARKMGLSGPVRPLVYQGANAASQLEKDSEIVEFRVKGTFDRAKEFTVKGARTVAVMSLPKQTTNVTALARDWSYLTQRPVEPMQNAEPEILIGVDNVALITAREVIHGAWNAPYLIRTWLGWIAMGKIGRSPETPVEYACTAIEEVSEICDVNNSSFTIEDFDVNHTVENAVPREDKKSFTIMELATDVIKDSRFEESNLWKDEQPPEVSEDRPVAMIRPLELEHKLDEDPELTQEHCEKMTGHVQDGYLQLLSEEQKKLSKPEVCFSPTLAVSVKIDNTEMLKEKHPGVIQEILNCRDDYLEIHDTPDEAKQLVRGVIKVQSAEDFRMVNWCTSDVKVLDDPPADYSYKDEVKFDDSSFDKAITVRQMFDGDMFTFCANFHRVPPDILYGEKTPTIRELLRLVMSIFGPLGDIGMFVVKGRMILQEIRRAKIGWSPEDSGELCCQWLKFVKLKGIEKVREVYLRVIHPEGVVVECLIVCTRVAPTKKVKIPRLELQDAVLNTHLGECLEDTFEMQVSDSEWSTEKEQKEVIDEPEMLPAAEKVCEVIRKPMLPDVKRFFDWWRKLMEMARVGFCTLRWFKKHRERRISGENNVGEPPPIELEDIAWAKTERIKEVRRGYVKMKAAVWCTWAIEQFSPNRPAHTHLGLVSEAVRRRQKKRWGDIFTLLARRAICMKIATYWVADSAVAAIRRFLDRRGKIEAVRYDGERKFERFLEKWKKKQQPNSDGEAVSIMNR